MNKKLIAAAIAAGLALPVAAQAEGAKLYGQLQAEITDWDRDGGTNDRMEIDDAKRGRLGVKGNVDLGNGMKGIYKFEWQVDTSDADSNDGPRESFVGVKGGFGTVTIGANKSPYKYFGGVKYDPFVATTLEARGNGGQLKQEVLNKKFGQNGFVTDSISYKMSNGGVTFWAVYGLDEAGTGDNDDVIVGLKFKINKNAEVFIASADEDGIGTNTKFGGQFKTGPHTISAQIEEGDADAAASADVDAMFVSYSFKSGMNTFTAQIGELDSTTTNADVDYMAVGVTHKFNKKARVFAGYRDTDSETNTADVSVITVGLRLDF